MSVLTLEYLPATLREGLVGYLRHAPSGWVFRFLPWRDPDQPRFWCLRVDVCTGPSLRARTTDLDPFYVALGMTRVEVTDALARIQADPATWLDQATQQAIRQWVTHVVRMPIPPASTSPLRRSARRHDPEAAVDLPASHLAGIEKAP